MAVNSIDAQSWGISITLHVLAFLIMIFWAAFPNIVKLPAEIEITFPEMTQPSIPERFVAPPRVVQQAQPSSSTALSRSPRIQSEQAAGRQAPASQTVAREPGVDRSAPSTTVQPREMRVADEHIDFMDFGGGKQERSSGTVTGDVTRRESRDQGLSTSTSTSRDVSGAAAGTERSITADPGSLSTTPHSSANIQWDGGVARSRIAGVLPAFPEGATRDAQVSVRFQVRPDGSMFGMTVVQKGDPLYERAALQAMRTWKFNALPADTRQADQVGTVTFIFKVR